MYGKQLLHGFIILIVLSFFVGCSVDQPKGGLTAWEMINNNALLIDVRTEGEFQDGHLSGAKLIPISQVSSRIAEFGEDKDREIVLYCKGGVRAAKAEKILRANGYTQVVNAGGYQDLLKAKP